jgi:hypothetical protein
MFTSLSSMIVGSPGAHVICSTDRLTSSHALAGIGLSGFPFLPSIQAGGGTLALTLAAGHGSRVGMKM